MDKTKKQLYVVTIKELMKKGYSEQDLLSICEKLYGMTDFKLFWKQSELLCS